MHNPDDQHLTSAEREAFEALPREQMPSRLLEERVVAELRSRGYLGASRIRHMNFGMFGRLGFAAAAAAAVALFASGLAVGQWIGGRHTADALLEMRKQDAASSAAAVQQAGSAYLSALDKLSSASSSSTANSQDMVAARQAAQTVLHQAANEMVRLAPDDPVSAQILQGLERAREQQSTTKKTEGQRVVWF